MDFQTIIVVAIVTLAVLFVAHRVWNTLAASKKKSAAGCASCDAAAPSTDDWAR
jgi:hypothetical protein